MYAEYWDTWLEGGIKLPCPLHLLEGYEQNIRGYAIPITSVRMHRYNVSEVQEPYHMSG